MTATESVIRAIHNLRCSVGVDRVCYISGPPRSGSTWLFEYALQMSSYRGVFEPFNRRSEVARAEPEQMN